MPQLKLNQSFHSNPMMSPAHNQGAVSYTHLDVYKRQVLMNPRR